MTAHAVTEPGPTCGCAFDSDGIALAQCAENASRSYDLEYRVARLLDAELDDFVRELAGRSPTRIERKPGAVGNFAIARPGSGQP